MFAAASLLAVAFVPPTSTTIQPAPTLVRSVAGQPRLPPPTLRYPLDELFSRRDGANAAEENPSLYLAVAGATAGAAAGALSEVGTDFSGTAEYSAGPSSNLLVFIMLGMGIALVPRLGAFGALYSTFAKTMPYACAIMCVPPALPRPGSRTELSL